jgi:1-acyl-sn-glycerol-3-phosphate acyltransferase
VRFSVAFAVKQPGSGSMHYTIFDTPVINVLMHWLARSILWLTGWRIVGGVPEAPKYVLIAAPHTSNWDFPVALMVCFALRLRVYWMGKASLFPPLLGAVMRWLGGIPVNRARSGNLVQATVDAYNSNQRLIVIVPPEGTRSKVPQWKTGFYYIALGAGVPIALGYLDFRRKEAGLSRMFEPTGDIAADMVEIQAFYAGFAGKNPGKFDG